MLYLNGETAPITKKGSLQIVLNFKNGYGHIFKVARGEKPIEKNVIVTDEFGNKLISTYPKRAKGLIKKGRAERVGENEIRLIGCSVMPCTEDNMNNTYNINNNDTESLNTVTIVPETGEVVDNAENAGEKTSVTAPEKNQPKMIFFKPRSWKPAKDADKTVAVRSFISNPFGEGLIEAYTIGDWNWNWSTIETADMILEKNADYEFVFWLNGGENEQMNEVCKLEVIFDNDQEDRYTYNLNRNFIRYEKHFKGWYLYRIPFNTGEACYTRLRFTAMRAYTTFIKAEEPESYSGLPEDLPPVGIPQRHNIVFTDGFPANASWSYKALGENATSNDPCTPRDFNFFGVNRSERKGRKPRFENFFTDEKVINLIMDGLSEELRGQLEDLLSDDLSDDAIDEVVDNLNMDGVREQIIQQIRDSLNI